MNNPTQHRSWIPGMRGRAAGAALALAIMLVPAVLATRSAQAQTYTESILYSFTGSPDGATPTAAQTSATSDDRSEPAAVPNTWSFGAVMPTARSGVAAGVIKGKVYVVGGESSSVVLNVNEIYNPAKNTWTTGAPMPTARWFPASAVVDNILYVIGDCPSGCSTGPGATSVVEAYDPATDTWSTKSPLPTATSGAGGVAVNGIIYVVGGVEPGPERVATVYSYNPATDTWAREASMQVPKAGAATGALGTTIVAAGGYTNGAYVSDNEIYSVGKNSWKTAASDPTARSTPCSWGIAGQLYVAGGGNYVEGSESGGQQSHDYDRFGFVSEPVEL
jgi:N-acetylneuraminic acid mutarotase